MTAISGFTLTPLVSSSKNLRSPAPWAGIRAPSFRFFLRTLMAISSYNLIEVLIKVAPTVSEADRLLFWCLLFVLTMGKAHFYTQKV
jgi:hypothetical protein